MSNVYEPGSVFKMMTATAALETGSVSLSTKINDVGTLHLDKGRTKVDDADRRAKGWMTFEDGVAFSRNVVAAKVALGLGKNTRQSSAILYDWWRKLGFGAPTGIDVAGEVPGIVRDPGLSPWAEIDLANGAFGQGVAVTPIQLATAYATLMNGGTTIKPHVVKAVGTHEVEPVPGAKVIGPTRSRQLIGLMNHVVTTVPFYKDRTLVPGLRRRRQDRARPRSGIPNARGGRGGWKVNLFNYSFIGYIARERRVPDLVVAIRIEEGKPTVVRVGQLEMPVMSFELFRRIATDAITTPDLLTSRPTPSHPDRGPVTAAYGRLGAVTDVDPSHPAAGHPPRPRAAGPRCRRPGSPDRRPTAGAVGTTHPGSRRRFARGPPGAMFVALPGERTDGHAFLAEAVAAGAAALLVTRPPADPAALGDVTVVRVADGLAALGAVAAGWRRRFDPLVVGVTGSIAKTSTKEAVAAVLGQRFRTLEERGQPEQRDRPAADVLRDWVPSTRRPSSRWACTSVARSPSWPGSAGHRSGSSPRSSRSTCHGSERSTRSRRPRANCSRRCHPGARRS